LTSFSISLSYASCLFETSVREAALEAIPQSKKSLKIAVPWWNKQCVPIQTRLLQNAMSHTTPIDPDLNQAFSINDLLSAINDTKNTAPGPDNICYEMFKHMSIKFLKVMLQLFNKT